MLTHLHPATQSCIKECCQVKLISGSVCRYSKQINLLMACSIAVYRFIAGKKDSSKKFAQVIKRNMPNPHSVCR